MPNMTNLHTYGVIVGRFQVHRMTAGHLDLFNRVFEKHKTVLVVLGCSPKRLARKNALTFEMRRQMISEEYPNADLRIAKITDVGNDEVWNRNLDKIINEAIPDAYNGNTVLYGSRDSFIKYYDGAFPTEALEAHITETGTEMRERVLNRKHFSDDFRAGRISAAYDQYPKTWATVDTAILNGKGGWGQLLLVRKPGEKKFQFCGGFSEPFSSSFEEDAIREVKEELKIDVHYLRYVGSALIDDWRYRDDVDKIKTTFFVAHMVNDDDVPDAKDDIEECRWFHIREITEENFQPIHFPLLALYCAWMMGLNPDSASKYIQTNQFLKKLYSDIIKTPNGWVVSK